MACIVVSRKYLVTKSEVKAGMVVYLVEIVRLSLDLDRVVVEVDIMMNEIFVGIVDCSEIDRRK